MKRTILAILLLISSSALAEFSEDFEGMVSSDLDTAPWYRWGGGGYLPGIVTGAGTNATNVVSMSEFSYTKLLVPDACQYEIGVLEFDWYEQTNRWSKIYLRESAGWNVVHFNILDNGGGTSLEVEDHYDSTAKANDVVQTGTWHHFKINWNVNANSGAGVYSVAVDGQELWMAASGPGYNYTGKPVTDILFYAYSYGGLDATQFDNVSIAESNIYTISGNAGEAAVTMAGLPGNPDSAGDGSYAAEVFEGWSGTVTPTLAGVIFDPCQRDYSNVTANLTSQDYTPYYAISGDAGVENVTMTGLPDNPVSDTYGLYVGIVPKGWTGTVIPTKYGYDFSPSQRSYTNVTAHDPNEDYTATPESTHTISGNVGTGGVTMTGPPGDPVISGTGGSYTAEVVTGWSGTVTPTHPWYTFNPTQKVYSNVTADDPCENYAVAAYLPPSVQLTPQEPTSAETVSIKVSGSWPDDAIPLSSAALVSDANIFFDIFDPLAVGSQVSTPWQQEQFVGPLQPGIYDIYGSILPETYDLIGWLESLTVQDACDIGLDVMQHQTDLDQIYDTISTTNSTVLKALADLYEQTVVGVYNETIVNLSYLRDEVEGLNRAIGHIQGIVDTNASTVIVAECNQTIISVTNDMDVVCDNFHDLFTSAGERANVVQALPSVVGEPAKLQVLENCAETLSGLAQQVAGARQDIILDLHRLRSDSTFQAVFPDFNSYVPASLGPVAVGGDGALERVIFGGPWGRAETMLSLGFDTLDEPSGAAWDAFPNTFSSADESYQTTWDKYQVHVSDTVLKYAVGDSMYRPSWFETKYGENADYYFRPSGYIGSGGFDYRHVTPRNMILTYLEGAAAFHRQRPFTFIYKGPWEAHPYYLPAGLRFEEHGHSVPAVQAFRTYLWTQYGSISALNAAWGSSYANFDAINPPSAVSSAFYTAPDENGQTAYFPYFPVKRLPATPLTYYFEKCRKDLYSDYFADCRSAIKAGDPCHPVASSNSGGIMNEGLIRSHDDLQMPDDGVDMWGKHPSGGYGWADSPYMYGLNRYFNKTLVSLEYYGYGQEEFGDDWWGTWQPPSGVTLENIYNSSRRDAWHEYSWNRRMLLFYWPTKLVEIRLPPGGELWTDGLRPDTAPLLRPWSGFVAAVKRRVTNLNDIIMNVPIIEPNIGVIHSGVSIINAYPTDSASKVSEDIFDRLLAKQYHFNVVAEEYVVNDACDAHYDTLDNYEVIILPYAQYFDDGFAAKLLNWVNNGGTLISIGPFGLYDKLGFSISNGAALVYPGTTFSYTDPDYPLSWVWQASGGSVFTNGYRVDTYGSGTVMTTLDGRALYRPEIGIRAGTKRTTRPPASDIVDPGGYSAAQQAFYDTLAAATQRKAWVTSGNVEMVIRQQANGQGPLYISLLNWDYKNSLDSSVVVNGEYGKITDLSITDGFAVPAVVNSGQTTFSLKLGPGEGLMFKLEE